MPAELAHVAAVAAGAGHMAVLRANRAPTATAEIYRVSVGQTLVVPRPGRWACQLANDSDPLTAVLLGGPAHGTLALNADGSFRYTPDNNYGGGLDSFIYAASDGVAQSSPTAVIIQVLGG